MASSWRSSLEVKDKLTLLFAFLLQLATIVWWASSITERVEANTQGLKQIEKLREDISQLRTDLAVTREALKNDT